VTGRQRQKENRKIKAVRENSLSKRYVTLAQRWLVKERR